MRHDMAKVVTERPRIGHGVGSVKTGGRVRVTGDVEDFDGGRTRLKMSRLGGCRERKSVGGECHKSFSDLLGPLRGYLRKQVGRHWDDVYSELSQTLDKRSLTGIHIWDHVRTEVQQHCWMGVSGTIYSDTKYGSTRYSPTCEVSGLYVHPLTRRLCWSDRRAPRYRPPVDRDVVKLGPLADLRRVGGIWYECRYGLAERWVAPRYGYLPGVIIRAGYFEDQRVMVHKRQLGRAELRARGLRNENRA